MSNISEKIQGGASVTLTIECLLMQTLQTALCAPDAPTLSELRKLAQEFIADDETWRAIAILTNEMPEIAAHLESELVMADFERSRRGGGIS